MRGRVVELLEGDAAWTVVDRIAAKYIGGPYSREQERVVAFIEPERQTVGMSQAAGPRRNARDGRRCRDGPVGGDAESGAGLAGSWICKPRVGPGLALRE